MATCKSIVTIISKTEIVHKIFVEEMMTQLDTKIIAKFIFSTSYTFMRFVY